MDLQCVLKEFLHSTYSHLKGIKLCGNLLVRNIFTSDIRYLPIITEQFGVAKLPKEISFHVPKGTNFTDLYNFITFPKPHKGSVKENVLVNQTKKHHVICEPVGVENVKPSTMESIPVKHPNTTTTREDARKQKRRQDKQSPTPVIMSTPAVSEDVSNNRQGAVERIHYRSSEETKVRMIPTCINMVY